MIILLRPFHQTFRIPTTAKTVLKTWLWPWWCREILSDESECHHSEFQILLNDCKEYKNVENISKNSRTLRNFIIRAFHIVKLVLTSTVSNTRSISRLKLVYRHLRTTMRDKIPDSLLVLQFTLDNLTLEGSEKNLKLQRVQNNERTQTNSYLIHVNNRPGRICM